MDTRGARARRVAAEARALGLAALPTFAALPPAQTLRIFLMLPVDSRLRCLEVSRAWRDALSGERALWTHLDLSAASGVARFSVALLRAAAARANGGLVSLNVPRARGLHDDALVAVCAANGRTLRELRLDDPRLSCGQIGALLRAAPSLQLLEPQGFFKNATEACQVLRREAHFAPVRLREVALAVALDDDEQLFEFTAACGAHASLRCIELCGVLSGSRAALEAVVDAALAAQVAELRLRGSWPIRPERNSGVNAASAPALARLLSNNTWLSHLEVRNTLHVPLADAPAAQALGAALRANRTLRCLELGPIGLFRDATVAEAVLGALVDHPSLVQLSLSDEAHVEDAAAAGAIFAALIAANAPALQNLELRHVWLGDAAVRPLVDALPSNTHLRELTLFSCNTSDDFARGPLLDAVRAMSRCASSSLAILQLRLPRSSSSLHAAPLRRDAV